MLIVDTYNVLHAAAKVPGLGRLDVARLRALIELGRWRRERVVLVIDGRGPRDTLRRGEDAGVDLDTGSEGISEVFSGSGGQWREADSVIEALLDREQALGRARRAVVVSSDKQVRAAAVGARAQGLSSEDFVAKLVEDARKARDRLTDDAGGRPEFARDGGMDPGRTEYWLRTFGLGDDAPVKTTPAAQSAPGPRGREPAPHRSPKKSEPPGDQDCAPEPNPDDVDMRAIFRALDPKARRPDDGPGDPAARADRPRPRR